MVKVGEVLLAALYLSACSEIPPGVTQQSPDRAPYYLPHVLHPAPPRFQVDQRQELLQQIDSARERLQQLRARLNQEPQP